MVMYKNNMIDLSIIIPAYNSEKYIEKCIMSCINQDLPQEKYEIIVVDDGSTDNTKQIINKLQAKYDCIKYYYQDNAAQGAARNNGLSKAQGKYIWFVDSDDWIEEDCLSLILNRLENFSLTGVLVAHATCYRTHMGKWCDFDEDKILTGKEVLTDKRFFISPTYAIWEKKYLLDYNLKFKERIFHEDTEFYPRLFYNASRIGAISKVCYYVYLNPTSTTRKINPKRAYDMLSVIKYIDTFKSEIIKENEVIQNMCDYIAMNINVILFNTFKMDKTEQKNINRLLFENKYLFKNLLNSRILKYKIEGYLFSIFPKNVITIYKLMQSLNSSPGRIK